MKGVITQTVDVDVDIDLDDIQDEIEEYFCDGKCLKGYNIDLDMYHNVIAYIKDLAMDVNELRLRPTERDLKTVVYELERIIK